MQASSAIRAGADALIALIEQDRHLAETNARAYLRQSLDEFQKRAREQQEVDAGKLRDAQQSLAEMQGQFDALLKAKRADERVVQLLSGRVETLQRERDHLRALLKESNKSTEPQNIQNAPGSLMSVHLVKYNIFHLDQEVLCFGEPWLSLFNELSSSDHPLTPTDRFSPAHLVIMLQNCIARVRQDKQLVQSLALESDRKNMEAYIGGGQTYSSGVEGGTYQISEDTTTYKSIPSGHPSEGYEQHPNTNVPS